MHKCETCSKELKGGIIEGLKCLCDVNPAECPIPENVICDGALCQLQLTIKLLEQKRDELEQDIDTNKEKLKELNNIHRIMGITPNGLSMLIQNCGVNIQGLNISVNPGFSWDKLPDDKIVTIGLHFMQEYERTAKQWAQFLNEKSLKINVKKELIQQTDKKLKQAEKIRKKELNSDGSRSKIKLTEFEKMVVHNIKILGMTQDQSVNTLESMGMKGECRNLKELGVI